MSALRAIGFTKNSIIKTALNNFNLSIEAGAIFGLLGANGAGKTFTVSLFRRFVEARRG